MSYAPDTNQLESATGFEPLGSSPALLDNTLQLATSPTLDAEEQEGHEQGQGSTRGNAATSRTFQRALSSPLGDPEEELLSSLDEAERDGTDPYETAFMELRILRLSSRRLLAAVIKLSRSGHLGRPDHSDMDDQMDMDIFDVHINLEATTNALSRSYVISGYRSKRALREESAERTSDHSSRLDVTVPRGRSDSSSHSSAGGETGEGAELWEWDAPTLDVDTSPDSLTAPVPLKSLVKDRETSPNPANLSHAPAIRSQWGVVLAHLDIIRLALPYQDLMTTIILLIFVELMTRALDAVFGGLWTIHGFWWPKEPRYQCWEAV